MHIAQLWHLGFAFCLLSLFASAAQIPNDKVAPRSNHDDEPRLSLHQRHLLRRGKSIYPSRSLPQIGEMVERSELTRTEASVPPSLHRTRARPNPVQDYFLLRKRHFAFDLPALYDPFRIVHLHQQRRRQRQHDSLYFDRVRQIDERARATWMRNKEDWRTLRVTITQFTILMAFLHTIRAVTRVFPLSESSLPTYALPSMMAWICGGVYLALTTRRMSIDVLSQHYILDVITLLTHISQCLTAPRPFDYDMGLSEFSLLLQLRLLFDLMTVILVFLHVTLSLHSASTAYWLWQNGARQSSGNTEGLRMRRPFLHVSPPVTDMENSIESLHRETTALHRQASPLGIDYDEDAFADDESVSE